MTGYATRPPARVYLSQTQMEQITPESFLIYSIPHRIHTAKLYRRGKFDMWHVHFHTLDLPRTFHYADFDTAKRNAADLVGRKAGADLQVFTPPQRYAMGQQQCPKLTGPAMVCGEPPEVGSVWCRWHPKGKRVEVS